METATETGAPSTSEVAALRAQVAQLQTALAERTWLEAGIHESNERYRNLFENLNDAAYLVSADDGAILAANRRAEALLGRARTHMLGRHHSELFPQKCSSDQCRMFDAVAGRGGALDFEGELLHTTGASVPVRFSVSSVTSRGQHMLLALATDITSRQRAEETLRRTNRAFRTLSACNHALVRAVDEHSLLHEMCRNIVEVGGYRLAWVGVAERDARKSVVPVAQVGFEEGYLGIADITWADDEHGNGPMGLAIRTGEPQVARDIATDPRLGPWRDEAVRRGYASTVALPLVVNDTVEGGLAIYAAEPDAFDADELELLKELAGDLAFGLQGMRARARQAEAEALMRANQQFVQHLLEITPDLCFVLDLDLDSYIYVNRRSVELLGYTTREVRAMGSQYLKRRVHPDDLPRLRRTYARVSHASDGEVNEHEYRLRHRLGDWRMVRERISVYSRRPDGSAQQFIGIVRDVTPLPAMTPYPPERAERERQPVGVAVA